MIALLSGCGPQAPAEGESAASTSEGGATAAGGSSTTGTTTGTTTSTTTSATSEGFAPTSTTTTTQATSGSTTDASTTGEPTPPDLPPAPPWMPLACETDGFEANDEAMLATAIEAPCNGMVEDSWYCMSDISACHGLGDHDWYSLPAALAPNQSSVLKIELRILPWGAPCNCDEEPTPTGPELAKTVEVYDAQTMSLLSTASNMEPWIWFFDSGPEFGAALLIHVVGPADVSWAYNLWINRQDSDWEDTCEC